MSLHAVDFDPSPPFGVERVTLEEWALNLQQSLYNWIRRVSHVLPQMRNTVFPYTLG